MSDAFACRMRLPLHPFFRAFLRSYNVCPYQVSPNFWTQAVGTWLIWQEVSPDYPMPLDIFHTLFNLNKCTKRDKEPREGVKDWYYLTPKRTHGPVITGHPSSIKHWRSQCLWAAGDWQCFSSDPVPEITVSRTLSHRREVPSFLLTEKDLAVIGKLYSFKEDFYGIVGSDHLYFKHNLMKKQGSSYLPRIGLASLAAKRIPSEIKEKSSDHDQKKTLAGLSLNGGEKDKDHDPARTDPKQNALVPTTTTQGLQLIAQKQEAGAKRTEKE
ncbi:Uncharacterized protein Fot_11040 [Forsythia ovata]|uniref:Transposase (putative) gypsy type domain-containing protein n=1 Tax=Forsythia ovata TaxID=205694 RepID=A0ABD1WIJ9_9LAMI